MCLNVMGMRRIILGAMLVCCSCFVQGQELSKRVDHGFVVGYPVQILSNSGSGIYLGYNPYVQINKLISLEGQAAYSFSNYRAFLSGESRRMEFASVHIGVRFQKNNSTRKLLPYLSLLGGLSSGVSERFIAMSFSGGLFLEYNKKFTLGVAIENHPESMLILKAKYTL